jgi:hypothetical protein
MRPVSGTSGPDFQEYAMSEQCGRLSAAVLALLVILLPAVASAQGTITGVVRDVSGGVLPGVTVEASSPVLIEKLRTSTTDAAGQYRIVDLRPGSYTLTFTLPGFTTVQREGIELTGSFTATVNADLRVGALEETVIVTGESPIVDVQGVAQQRVLGRDVIENIPSSRTHFGVATLIAGVQTNNGGDVGGTNAVAHVFLTAHGGRQTDQRVMIDGLSTANAEGAGQFSGYMPNMTTAAEMTVDTAAGAADQPTGGVRINIIPREGGNRFSGTFFASGMGGDALQSSNYTDDLQRRGLATPNKIKRVWDVNPGLGGPILRDRVWFYGSARWNGSDIYAGMFENRNAGDVNAWTYEADASKPAFNHSTQQSMSGRVTWQATPVNKFAFFYDRQERCWCTRQIGPTLSPEATNPTDYPNTSATSVTWSAPVTSRLLLEGGFLFRYERWGYLLPDTPTRPLIGVTEQSTGLRYRAPVAGGTSGGLWPRALNLVANYRGSMSYITGSHALKFGAGDTWSTREVTVLDNDFSLSYRFNNGIPNQLTQRATPFDRQETIRADLGAYAQDKWTIDRLTLNLGVRFDYFNNYFPEQHLGPAVLVPNRDITFPKTDWVSWKDLTPRLGAAYDLFGDGKTALKVTLNKYMLAFGLQGPFGNDSNPVSRLANLVTRSWTDGNRNFIPDCDLTNSSANGECGAMSDARFGQPIPSLAIDDAILRGWGKRGYNWEFTTGVQHQILPRVSVDAGYFRRWYGNFTTTDNRAVGPGDYSPFSVVAPQDPRLPGGGGYSVSDLYNLNPNKVGQVDNLFTFASNYGTQIEQWQGVDVGASTRFRDIVLQGGISTGRTLTDSCEILAALPEQSPTGRPYCRYQEGLQTQVKAFGSYTVPRIDVQVAATLQSLPGSEIAANYTASNAVVQPSLGRPLSGGAANVTVNLIEPGSLYGRRSNQLDLRLGKLLRAGPTRTMLSLDLYNVLNHNTVLTQSNNFAVWQQPQSIMQARFIKFSAQVDF